MLNAMIEIRERQRQPLTPWELPSLLNSVHTHRASRRKAGRERKHFPAILGFVYRNRFAVASQIQHRFSDVLRSDRTARRHLEELEALGYLAVAPARGVSPLFPKVYYVTGRGVKKLRKSLVTQGKAWQAVRVDRRGHDASEGYSAERIIHEILTSEFLLAVWQTVHGRADLELLTIQRRSLAKHSAFRVAINGHHTRLIPDAMFLFRQAGGGMVCCFAEMDNGTMNTKQIRKKYARYLAWSQSAAGQQYLIDLYRRQGASEPKPTFRLLIIARSRTGKDDLQRMQELRGPATKLPAMLKDRLWFTTVADLCRWQQQPLPLDAAVWRRGQDVHRLGKMTGARDGREKGSALRPDGATSLLHKLFPETPTRVSTNAS
jgi:hypothetical protein